MNGQKSVGGEGRCLDSNSTKSVAYEMRLLEVPQEAMQLNMKNEDLTAFASSRRCRSPLLFPNAEPPLLPPLQERLPPASSTTSSIPPIQSTPLPSSPTLTPSPNTAPKPKKNSITIQRKRSKVLLLRRYQRMERRGMRGLFGRK